jgi:AcrR family transcriptional regulator
MRIIAAMAQVTCEPVEESRTVARVAEIARVSRQTFRQHFVDRSDCLLAMFEEVVAFAAKRAGAAYRSQDTWVERMRGGLLALLELIDEEPELARVCVVQAITCGLPTLTRDGELLGELERILDEERAEDPKSGDRPAGTAGSVISGTLALLYLGLHSADGRPLVDLINPAIAVIVLPYLGAAAARRELSRPSSPGPPSAI